MLGKRGTHTLCDAIIHTLGLDYHQPIPNVRKFLYQVRSASFRCHPHLGHRSCACVLRDFPRVDTDDGDDYFREVPGLQGLPTTSQYVRSVAHPILGLCPEVEGEKGGD